MYLVSPGVANDASGNDITRLFLRRVLPHTWEKDTKIFSIKNNLLILSLVNTIIFVFDIVININNLL